MMATLVLLATACGTRSELVESFATTTGSDAVCRSAVLNQAIVTVVGPSTDYKDPWQLVALEQPSLRAGLVVGSLEPSGQRFVIYVIDAWHGWPPEIAPPIPLTTRPSVHTPAADLRVSSEHPIQGALVLNDTEGRPLELDAPSFFSEPVSDSAGYPFLVANLRTRQVLGAATFDGQTGTHLAVAGAQGLKSYFLGCGEAGPSVAAAPLDDGWLLASELSGGVRYTPDTQLADCSSVRRSPQMLSFFVVPPYPSTGVRVGDSVPLPWQPVISMVPRNDGAWVSWFIGSSATTLPVPTLFVARLDRDAHLVNRPLEIEQPGEVVFYLGGALKNAVLTETIENISATGQILHVMSYDDALERKWSVDLSPNGVLIGGPNLLGSPDGNSILVAWEESTTTTTLIRLARIDCRG